MPQFQNDLVPGVMAGASIVNQAWQRQERMMELRAQAAQQAMREREIAAQASYLTQHAAQIKAQVDQQQQDQIDLQAVNDLFHQQTEIGGKDPRTAMLNVLPAAALKNPRVGKHLADTLAEMDKSTQASQKMEPFVPSAVAVKNPGEGPDINLVQTAPNKFQFTPEVKKGALPSAVQTLEYRRGLKQQISDAEESGDWDSADDLRDDLHALDKAHPDLKEKAKYQAMVNSLRLLDTQLGDRSYRSRWPDLEKRKARIQKQLGMDENAGVTQPQAGTTGNKYLKWTPQGMVPATPSAAPVPTTQDTAPAE